jgi:hypothetical protein
MDGASPLPRYRRTSSCLWSHRLVPLDKPPVLFTSKSHWSRCFQTVALFTVCCVVLVSIGSGGYCPAVPSQLSEAFLKRESNHAYTHLCSHVLYLPVLIT